VAQLGANAFGEVLEPGRVPDCYLGLRLDPPAAEVPEVLVVAPASLLHPCVPQPDGSVLYELVTGHPDRTPRELVFLADLAVELRAWPTDTWSKVGIDPHAAAGAVVAGWQRGDLPGLRLGGLTAQEALALERPAMTYLRAQLGDRLSRQLARAPGGGGTRPAAAGPATGSGSRAHRPPAAASRADSGRPDTGHGFRKQRWTADAGSVPGPRPTGHPLRGHHPAVRTASPGGRRSASISDTLAVSAGGGRCPLPAAGRCVRIVGYRRPRCPRPAQSRGPLRGGQRPSGQHPAAPGRTPRRTADTAAVSGSVDTCWGSVPGPRSQRADSDGPGAWTVDAAGGHRQPQAPGAADTRDGGSVARTLRQRHAGQPAAQPSTATPRPTRNGTARCGSGQHPMA
jgi:hypothetical protein